MTLKPVQQANGKRSLEQARGRLLRLHGPRYLFGRLLRLHDPRYLVALFSTACCACTALVIFSLSFRPPAALAQPSFSFRSPFGRLLSLNGLRHLFPLFSAAC